MKNIITITLLLILSIFKSFSQVDPQLTWIKSAKNEIPLGDKNEGEFISYDNFGNKIIAGYFKKTADFDPSTESFNLTSNGLEDIYIAKYSPNNTLLWAKSIGGYDSDLIKSITLDGENGVLIAGAFGYKFKLNENTEITRNSDEYRLSS